MDHPHRRRLPRHARHLVKQLLKPRFLPKRASVLAAHVRQIDSAVNLHDRAASLPGDTDRMAAGQRVVLGPESRSLLRQLLESRDLRVQQQLVREIVHQMQKRIQTAAARSQAAETARRKTKQSAVWLAGRAKAAAALVRSVPSRLRSRRGPHGWNFGKRTAGNTAMAARTRVPVPARGVHGFGTVADKTRVRKPAPKRASRTRS
jgi:hypothetical protein